MKKLALLLTDQRFTDLCPSMLETVHECRLLFIGLSHRKQFKHCYIDILVASAVGANK